MQTRSSRRLLAVFAHPDDAEFMIGGTVAAHAAAGDEITYAVLTDGDAGGWDPAVPREDIPGIRRDEQRKAAELLGVAHVEFLGYAEGALPDAGRGLHVELVSLIRRTRPDVIMTWSPEWNWSRFHACHPDHLATGTAVLRAAYPDAGNPFALRAELGELAPWNPPELWLFNAPHPNHHVDVTERFDQKLAAVSAHASQIPDPGQLSEFVRRRLADNAAGVGLPPGRLAELFQVVDNR